MVLEKIISAIASVTMMSSVVPSGLNLSVLPEDSVVEQASEGEEDTTWTVIDYTNPENQTLSEEDLALMHEDNWLNRLVVEHSNSHHSLDQLDLNDFLAVTKIRKPYSDITELPESVKFLSNLTSLYLYGNELIQLPESIGNLTKLSKLTLISNNLTSVPNSIGNLTNLTELNLERNKLTQLPDSIGNLTNLTTLKLYENKLTSVPDSIGNLTNLTLLDLERNKLTSVPNSIGNLTNLTSLCLTSTYKEDATNKFTELPDTIGNLTKLTELDLSYLGLTSIPESIGNLTNLTSLNLRINKLTSLPDSIGNLTNLTSLNLLENNLTSLPDSIGSLTKLIELDLGKNEITSIPDSIGNLTSLTKLNLSGNNFTDLPDSICDLISLETLDIGDFCGYDGGYSCVKVSKLNTLPDRFDNLSKLKVLDLSTSEISSIPESLYNLTNLTKLDLSGMSLTNLSESIGNLTNLTELNLGNLRHFEYTFGSHEFVRKYNQLTSLPESIGNLTNLTKLDLGHNKLTSVPESIGNLTNLTELNLSENYSFTSLPNSMSNLSNLASLDVSYNHLVELPELNKSIRVDASRNYLTKKYTTNGNYEYNPIDSVEWHSNLSEHFYYKSIKLKINSDRHDLLLGASISYLPDSVKEKLVISSSNPSIVDNNGNAVGCGICDVTFSLPGNPEGNQAGQTTVKVQVNGNVQMTASQPNKNITNQDSPIDWSVTSEEGYDRMVLPDGTESTETSGTWNAPSNGTYTFKAYDSVGNFTQTDVVVSNIDKTNPVLNITGVPQGDSVQGPVTLNYTASDEHYSKIKLPNGNSSNGTEGEYVVRRNGTYLFTAFDTAGNSTTETLKITNLVRRNDVSADDADNAIQDAKDDLTLDTLQSAMDSVMGMPNGAEKDSRVAQITALQQQYLAKSGEDITDKLQVINSMIDNTNGNKIMGVSNDGVDRSSTINAIKTLEPKDRSSLVTNLVEATDNLEGTFIDGGNKLESSTNNVKLEVGQTLTPKDLVNVTYNGVTLSEDQINSLKIIKETGSESLLSDSNKAVNPGVAKVRVKLTSESDNETSNHSSLTASTNPFVNTVGKIVDKAISMFSVNADPSEDPTVTDPIDVTIVEKPVISSGTTSASGDVTVKYELNETAQLSLSTQVVDFGVSTGISEVSQETPMIATIKSSAVYDLDLSPQTNLVNEEDPSVEIPSTKASISFNDAVDFTALPVPNSSLNLVTNGNATTALENRSKVYNMNFKIGDVIGSKAGKYTMPIRITLTQK